MFNVSFLPAAMSSKKRKSSAKGSGKAEKKAKVEKKVEAVEIPAKMKCLIKSEPTEGKRSLGAVSLLPTTLPFAGAGYDYVEVDVPKPAKGQSNRALGNCVHLSDALCSVFQARC
jgi:hypothetical protein